MTPDSVGIFCGSNTGNRPEYEVAAKELARLLAENGIATVYGGGSVGLMGILADEMLQYNGKVIGVIPEKLEQLELGHRGISELIIVDSMHARKARIAELSNAYIAMAGGMGTLEEITEMFTLTQLGYFDKACILLNTCGYYNPLIEMMDKMVEDGFLRPVHRRMMLVAETPAEALQLLQNYEGGYHPKWVKE